MDFLQLAHERYSCRMLSDRPVEEEKLSKILDAAIAAPTGVNAQPFKLWVIRSEEAKEVLKTAHKMRFIDPAPYFIIVGSCAEKAWTRPYDGYNIADVDASIVATHIMLAIEDQGLASTWIGYFDQAKLKEAFPSMEGYQLMALFPVAYAAEEAAPSPRHTERKGKEELVEIL